MDALTASAVESHGSQAQFIAAYDEYRERMYRYHYYRLRHRETAEDLTSQTFVKALEGFQSFDASKGSMATWLYRIARNTFIDHLRRLHPNEQMDDELMDSLSSLENVAGDVATKLEAEQATALLRHLTPEQREVILLRLWDDLSYAEIAEMTGKTEGACKMAYRRGLDALRAHAGPLAAFLLLIHSIR
jgi:RNA polymerase sigma-70 factor (ECF subfamily)